VFPLEVSVWTPDGSQLIAQSRQTVRSTAVSGVGVVLIVLAIVSLGIWWVRDLRHGRRARQLVPAPEEEAPNGGHAADSNGAADPTGAARADPADHVGVGTPAAESDTMVQDFFSTPAPDYRDRATGSRS
jgi:hypothetical protein